MRVAISEISRPFSILKGIGIILMVVGHTHCPQIIHDFIYLFHMSLFYFASGFFFKEKYLYQKKNFLFKRIKKLYGSWLIYGIIFLLLHNFFVKVGFYQEPSPFAGFLMTSYDLNTYLSKGLTIILMNGQELLLAPLWFLKSLLVSSILLLIILYLSNKFNVKLCIRHFIFCLLLILGWILIHHQIHLPLNLARESIVLSILYLGFVAKQNIEKIPFNRWGVMGALGILLFLTQLGHIELSVGVIWNPLFFAVCTIAGIYLVLGFSIKLCEFKLVSEVLVYLGNHTIEILCFHFLIFKLISLICGWDVASFPTADVSFAWILYSFAGVCIPILISFLIKQIKI